MSCGMEAYTTLMLCAWMAAEYERTARTTAGESTKAYSQKIIYWLLPPEYFDSNCISYNTPQQKYPNFIFYIPEIGAFKGYASHGNI